MTLGALLILTRWAHLFAVSLLFGAALFPFYNRSEAAASANRALRGLPQLLISSAALALASGILWFLLAELSGPIDLRLLWLGRLLVTGALLYLLVRARHPHELIVLIGSGLLLITLAAFAHDGTQTPAAAAARVVIDVIHLLASGVWVGALVMFLLMLATPNPTQNETQFMHDALARFSVVGTGVVIALTASGLVNSGMVGPRNPLQSFNSLYSQVLAGKIGLFLLMLGLATANRYWLTPKLHAALVETSDTRASIRALKASIAVETALVLFVLGAVGWLDALPPPGAQ